MEQTRREWKCVSGSVLKLIAMVTMLIDHVTLFYMADRWDIVSPLFTIGTTQVSIYYLLRSVGRVAFPLYCFFADRRVYPYHKLQALRYQPAGVCCDF